MKIIFPTPIDGQTHWQFGDCLIPVTEASQPKPMPSNETQIRAFGLHNPLIHTALTHVQAGHLSWPDAMEVLVITLAAENKRLSDEVLRLTMNRPSEINL